MTESKINRFNTLHDIYNAFCDNPVYDIQSPELYLPYERWIVDLYNCNFTDIQQHIDKCIPTDNVEECYKYLWVGHYYNHIEKNYDLMKKYYLMAIEKGNTTAMTNLAYYYRWIEKDYDLMKKYYLMAIDKGDAVAMSRLGHYYKWVEKDYEAMKIYYLMVIDKDNISAMNNLGYYYHFTEHNYDLMRKYYLMAIVKGCIVSAWNLAFYYQYIEKDYILAIKYYIIYFERKQSNSNFDYITKNISNPIICCYICNKLNVNVPSSHKYYKYYIKINKHMSNHNCDICMSDNVECVPVNLCNHEVCIYCYINLYDKACPYCRMA